MSPRAQRPRRTTRRPPRRQGEEQVSGFELPPPGLERGGGEAVLPPSLGLPAFVERRRRPGPVERNRALGERQSDDQRTGDRHQRRQSGELERIEGGDGAAEPLDARRRLLTVD